MHMNILPVYMSVYHVHAMHGICRNQKPMLEILGAEWQMLVSHPVGAGNRTQVLCKNNRCPWPLSQLFSPRANFLAKEYSDTHIQVSSCLCFPGLVLQAGDARPSFLCQCLVSNPGPCAYTPCSSFVELSPSAPPLETQSHYVDQGDLELRDPTACASGVLVLKVCTTMPGPSSNFLKLIMRNKFSFKR